MMTRRYRKAKTRECAECAALSDVGKAPQKGQFSYLPGDVWVEGDGGKQLGNENEFPPDPARELEEAIIDEVNTLRNDVSQRAASRRGKWA